ncbi:transposase domain-containing protein [Komagataeibacter pomaceti]|uniref:IS66 family transposase n=1 Tax=Novacetimonas pomaceti TaxID=2021998 RepID=UPI001C2D1C5F|nr:transposase domain-containing protein [Novacetimonas pomaceti]MBV1835300.1 transposase domain-containing protein [Novacetimonas pomaceti]
METGTSEIDRLRAALVASEAARQEAEQRATGGEAMVAHLKLLIARMRQDRFGASSERGRRLLDQLELELEDLETAIAEDDAANAPGAAISSEAASERQRPARQPFPADLPRERVIIPVPAQCPCCGSSRLAKLGESVTETLEVIPRRFKVIQTVREKFSCRDCESITQPPAPFHPIARGRAGPWLLSTILTGKFADHLPLNRQSAAFAREGIDLDTSTLADWVGACTATLAPLIAQVRAHERWSPFFGQRAADIYSLVVTAKLNDIDPQAWLAEILARINDQPVSRLHELLPWNWKTSGHRYHTQAV